ncbi:hypothetical protein PG996_007549 [Apiospora saccharicola]|uniref:Uncharacterized protein n=1 Tax=Apiospora saccharicola TaxID=335842 RepID=A0ABR1VC18_9PEZI
MKRWARLPTPSSTSLFYSHYTNTHNQRQPHSQARPYALWLWPYYDPTWLPRTRPWPRPQPARQEVRQRPDPAHGWKHPPKCYLVGKTPAFASASLLRSVEKQRRAYDRCRARVKLEGQEVEFYNVMEMRDGGCSAKSTLGTGWPPFTPTNKTGSALLPATVAAAVQEIASAVVKAFADNESELFLET